MGPELNWTIARNCDPSFHALKEENILVDINKIKRREQMIIPCILHDQFQIEFRCKPDCVLNVGNGGGIDGYERHSSLEAKVGGEFTFPKGSHC